MIHVSLPNISIIMKVSFRIKTALLSIGFLIVTKGLSIAQVDDWVAPKNVIDIKNPLAGNAEATKKGNKLYAQMCAICHGDLGKGDGIAGASLNPSPGNFTLEKIQSQTDGVIFWKLTTGRPPMISYSEFLTEDQRWQLVNYIRVLGQKK